MFNKTKANQRVTRFMTVLAACCLSFTIAQPASADPIVGEVAFVGLFTATGGSGPTDLLNATGIDFNVAVVAQATGDFNFFNGVVPFLSPVTLNDFTFAPFTGPIDPLWEVGAFQFALASLTSVYQGTNYLALAGTGTVSSSAAGLDDTAFNWSFSGDSSGGKLQLFSSTASPTALPEPSELTTLGFLAIGVGALCLLSRRQRKAVQQ